MDTLTGKMGNSMQTKLLDTESHRLSPESWILMFMAGFLTYTFFVCLPIQRTVTLSDKKTSGDSSWMLTAAGTVQDLHLIPF